MGHRNARAGLWSALPVAPPRPGAGVQPDDSAPGGVGRGAIIDGGLSSGKRIGGRRRPPIEW